MKKAAICFVVLLCMGLAAFQYSNYPASIKGAVVANHCASFVAANSNQIQDSGSACGSSSGVTGPGSSTNTDLATWSGTGGNTLADGGVAVGNVVTAASNYTNGDLVQAAGANKTTSDSGVVAANVVTATGSLTNHGVLLGAGSRVIGATAAGTAGQPLVSGGTSADPGYNRGFTTAIPSSDTISAAGSFATTLSLDGTNLAVGSVIEIRAHGVFTTTSTASPIMTMNVTAGGTSSICPQNTNSTLGTSLTNAPWDLVCYIQIVTTGNPGTAIAWGGTNSGASTQSRSYANTGTVSYITGNSQTVSVSEGATLVSGQTFTIQSLYARPLF